MGRGRKPVLTWREKMAVGGECNRLRQDFAVQQALAKHWNQPHQRDVKRVQSELMAAPVTSRESRVWQDAWRQASSEIAEILSEVEVRLPIRVKRPYGKHTEILDAAIRWCAERYGKTITRRRAQDCWDEFSAMMKRLQNEPKPNRELA